MTNSRRRPIERNKAIKKFIKWLHKNDVYDTTWEMSIFKKGFNMGWKAHRNRRKPSNIIPPTKVGGF